MEATLTVLFSKTPYVLLSVVAKLVSGVTRNGLLHWVVVPVVRQILLAFLLKNGSLANAHSCFKMWLQESRYVLATGC